MFNSLIRLFVSFLTIFITFSSFASDFHSPRTAALGGAGHAGPLLSDAIYLNPAYTSFVRTHSFSVNYETNSAGHILNLSVLDGTQESLFQAGVAYTRRGDASVIHIGAAKNALETLGFGLGGKFVFPNDNSGERLADITFSTYWALSGWLQASLIVDNIIESAAARGFTREVTLGTKINADNIFYLYLDPLWIPGVSGPQQWGYEAGAEFPFFKDFFLRVGIFRNANQPQIPGRADGYGIGAGWVAPRLSLDYSFSRVTDPISAFAHTFGATIFF